MIQKEEFYFDSRDGEHKIHSIRWVPEHDKPVCVLQIIHGMTEHIDRYDGFAQYMAGGGGGCCVRDSLWALPREFLPVFLCLWPGDDFCLSL